MESQTYRLRVDWNIAAQRVRVALLKIRAAELKAGFRQDQPRGSDGRWTGGSGNLIVTRRYETGNRKIDSTTDQIIDILDEVVGIVGRGNGPTYGVQIHVATAAVVRSLDLPGIGSYGVEQSFSLGDTVRYGLAGSIRTDIVLRNGRTADAPVMAVWDIKTGGARLSLQRATEIRTHLGVGSEVPIIEVHIDRGVDIKFYLCSH